MEEKVNIVADGVSDITIRHGNAAKVLDEKEPVKINISGTIESVKNFIEKRVDTFDHKKAHISVNREELAIELVINECDAYTRGSVCGTIQMHPKFVEFGINRGKVWSPTELGLQMKMNRSFFPSLDENRKLVSTLMHFTADVNQKVDRMVQENGNRADSFTQVVNSNLPDKFTMRIPIFKGAAAETLEVETFAQVDGREVKFMLLSPGANDTLESIRDAAIDRELDAIREMADDIVIIEE